MTRYRSGSAVSSVSSGSAGSSVSSVSAAEPAVAPRTIGVSLGHLELPSADHWILSLAPAPELACTHLVQAPYRHVAISLLTSATYPTLPDLSVAALAAAEGKSGRAVLFPGSDKLVGTLTVAEVLSVSAIDKVEVLGSGPATAEDQINTRDFVRPQYRLGELVLTTTPAAGGLLVPFETRNPTPCCANH